MELQTESVRDTYHDDTEYIGKSGLDIIDRSPARYYALYLDPNAERPAQTPAMGFGSLVHTVVFEPHKVEKRYTVAPPDLDRRTNAGKAWWAENSAKTIVTAADMEAAQNIAAAVRANEFVAKVLAEGEAEKPIFATDPITGARVKIKPDWINPARGIILDLKTTPDARPDEFARSCANYRYHVQDAFYTDVAGWAGLGEFVFVFVAVEKDHPHCLSIYVLDDDSRELGRKAYRRNLLTYSACLESGIWHGHPTDVQPLRLPNYQFYK